MAKKVIFSNDEETVNYSEISNIKEHLDKRNIKIGEDVYLIDGCRIGNNVEIGNNSIILSSNIPKNSIIAKNVKLFANHLGGQVNIGKNTTIEEKVNIYGRCTIGENVTISSITILNQNCVIGDDSKLMECVLGDKTIIGKNVTISKRIRLKEKTTISDNTFLNSVVFFGSKGYVTYWGTDEVHMDMGVNNFDENYRVYSVNEFQQLFLFKNSLYKLEYDEKAGSVNSYFTDLEIKQYKQFCDLITLMHKNQTLKPIIKGRYSAIYHF